MSVEAQIPAISNKVALETITKYLLDPKGAVRETAQIMDQENPHLLGHSIVGAFAVMYSMGDRAALVNLKGGLYYYQCYSREAAKEGIPLIKVRRSTVRNIFEKEAEDLSSFYQIEDDTLRRQFRQQASDQREAFTKALGGTNPDLLAFTEGFAIEEQEKKSILVADVPLLSQGGIFIVHNALNQELKTSSQDESDNEQDSDQALGQSFFPSASDSSVRESLVEIILDRKEFTQASLGYLRKYSSDWADALDKAYYPRPFTKNEYELFISLVVGIYYRAFKRRGMPFPPVSLNRFKETLGIEIKDGRFVGLPEPQLRTERAYETLTKMEAENLPLYRAYNILASARGLSTDFNILSQDILSQVALFATTDAYSLIKAQAEVEYWEKMTK